MDPRERDAPGRHRCQVGNGHPGAVEDDSADDDGGGRAVGRAVVRSREPPAVGRSNQTRVDVVQVQRADQHASREERGQRIGGRRLVDDQARAAGVDDADVPGPHAGQQRTLQPADRDPCAERVGERGGDAAPDLGLDPRRVERDRDEERRQGGEQRHGGEAQHEPAQAVHQKVSPTAR